MSKFSVKEVIKIKAVYPGASYSIEGIGGGTFAIASTKPDFNRLKESDANVVYYQKKGKLYLNANGSSDGWGAEGVGGLLAKFQGKPKPVLSADHFEGFSTYKKENNKSSGIDKKENNESSGIDIGSLLKKFDEMEKTVKKLQKSNRNLRNSNNSLKESIDSLSGSGGSSKNNSTNKDDITGLDARVSSLEDHVKIDRDKLSASNPNAGIGYFILRNQEDIKSNTSQFDSVYKRFAALESNIAGNHISDYTNFDVISKINDLTSRLSAVEDALG